MKAEEWLTYFIKIYGRRPKMTEVDEAIQDVYKRQLVFNYMKQDTWSV